MRIKLAQNDKEFRALLGYLRPLQPANLVEVGTRAGGSLFMLSRVLQPNATIISVDLPGLSWGSAGSGAKKKKIAQRLRREGFTVHLVERNSNLPETAAEVSRLLRRAPIELLFLDADHTFDGVLADYLNYRPLVKSNAPIVFHDIIESPRTPEVQVHYLWRALKAFLPHIEMIGNGPAAYGIGVAASTPHCPGAPPYASPAGASLDGAGGGRLEACAPRIAYSFELRRMRRNARYLVSYRGRIKHLAGAPSPLWNLIGRQRRS